MIPRIACVLRSGGPYGPEDVAGLLASIRRVGHLVPVVCFTDVPDEVLAYVNASVDHVGLFGVRALARDWPSWFAKIEAFQLEGPVLYFDLDTRVVGRIDQLIAIVQSLDPNEHLMLDGFYAPEVCSGIMGWNGDQSWLVRDFEAVAARARFVSRGENLGDSMRVDGKRYRGDQNWIAEKLSLAGRVVRSVQAELPGKVVSFKVHVHGLKGDLPEGARVVCFHGRPRPRWVRPRPEWLTFPEPRVARCACAEAIKGSMESGTL